MSNKETKIVEVYNFLQKLEEMGVEKRPIEEIVKILDRISVQDARFDEQNQSCINVTKRNARLVNWAVGMSIVSLIIAVFL